MQSQRDLPEIIAYVCPRTEDVLLPVMLVRCSSKWAAPLQVSL